MAETVKKATAKKAAAKKTAVKKTAVKKTAAKKTAVKKTTAKKPAAKKAAEIKEPAEKTLTDKIVELCEQVAYERKAENILRLDMRGIETAQSDFYIICTGFSEPHIGSIAEQIQRKMREVMAIRPLLCNGDARSHWIIVDFGYVIIHVMTPDAREKYQLEELWGDAPRLDIVAKLDKEAEKRRAEKDAK